MAKKRCKGGVCALKNMPRTMPAPKPYSAVSSLPSPGAHPGNGDVQRSLINTQLSPLNAQSPQNPMQNFSLGQPIQQQQANSLQQNLSALPGANTQNQEFDNNQANPTPNESDINSLLEKVNTGAQLQPQEAEALNEYIQQYLPQQQQQGQYNPQDYLQGPLTGFLQDNQQSQSQNVPYEQSPFFQYANQIQNNPNAPQALKKPGFWKNLWNGIKGPLFNIFGPSKKKQAARAANLAARRAQDQIAPIPGHDKYGNPLPGYAATGSPGSVQAGQQGNPGDPYGLIGDQGRSQVLSPNGQQRGFWSGLLKGEHPEVYQVSNLTPYQQKGSNYILDQALRGLQNNNPNFAPIANQQLEQFYTQTVPSLAERFTSMGNGQRSSAFQGSLANAGRFLRNDLAAQNQQFNQQNLGHYTNLLNYGLQPRFENTVNPGTEGILPGGVKAAGNAAKAGISYGMMAA